jgi:hypothetical protein
MAESRAAAAAAAEAASKPTLVSSFLDIPAKFLNSFPL